MRVMFCCIPGLGHFFPHVPLAWAFRAAGHEVLFAFAEHTERAARTGLHVVDIAPGFSSKAAIERSLDEDPEFAERFRTERLDDSRLWASQFASVQRPLIPGTMDLVDDWQPDMVVYDQSATLGLMAAARRGVPAVQRNLGAVRTGQMHHATAVHLAGEFERYDIAGLPEPMATLEYLTPSMLLDKPEGYFLRHVPYNGGEVIVGRLPRPDGRRRVAITLGTINPQILGVGPAQQVLAVAAGIDAEFLLLLGDADPGMLGTLPANVRSVGWAPLDLLLRTCTAVIHHGGPGTTMTAIDAGVPQLIVLYRSDQISPLIGEGIRHTGAGLVTIEDDVPAELLTRLLDDDGLRTNARIVSAENAAQPSPADIVAQLTELAKKSTV